MIKGAEQTSVSGWDYAAEAQRTVTVHFRRPDGKWRENSAVVATGPNGGLYADVQSVADGDLEQFALDILAALKSKRESRA
jgi:hypothetical protein